MIVLDSMQPIIKPIKKRRGYFKCSSTAMKKQSGIFPGLEFE